MERDKKSSPVNLSSLGAVVPSPLIFKHKVVRPERFELPTFWFVARRSIQLSYGRNVGNEVLSPNLPHNCQENLAPELSA